MEEKIMSAAEISVLGVIGSYVSLLFGGWSDAMTTLLIFMVIDYITGLCVAVAGRSDKTKTGGLNSKIGYIGLLRKGMIMLMLIVASRLDLLLDSTFVKDMTCIAFVINETISIIENVGKFVPIPRPILKAIDILKARNNDEEDDDHNGKPKS